MLLFFILLPNLFFIIGILHYTFGEAASQKTNQLFFLVTLPLEANSEPELQQLIKDYKKDLKRLSLSFLILGSALLSLLLIPFFQRYIGLTLPFILAGYIFFPIFLYNRLIELYRQKTLTLKQTKNWQVIKQEGKVLADLKTSRLKNQKSIAGYWFTLPIILSLIIFWAFPHANQNGGLTITLISGLVIHLLCWAISYAVCHMPAKIYADNSQVNLSLNQNYRRSWTRSYLALSFLQTLFMFGMAYFFLNFENEGLRSSYLVLLSLMPLLTVVLVLYSYYKIKRQEELLLNQQESRILDEEDAYFEYHPFWGHLYNNPHNPAATISKPFGIGQTLNLGAGRGRLYFNLTKYLILLGVMAAFLVLVFEEMISPALGIRQEELYIGRSLYPMTISIDQLEKVEYLNQTDFTYLTKIVGSATSRYARGSFSAKGEPKLKLYLFWDNPKALVFTLKDDSSSKIYFNYKDSEATDALFQKLKEKLPSRCF